MTTAPRIQLILGIDRDGRFSEKAAAWVVDRLADRDDLHLEVVDLRDHPLPFPRGRSTSGDSRRSTRGSRCS